MRGSTVIGWGHAGTAALVDFVNQTARALDGSQFTSGVFCDLPKALDCVHNGLLLLKLDGLERENPSTSLPTEEQNINEYQALSSQHL
ncbi:hypothetical protein J6590_037018 [Homalodisca vitripennis]|nr:hypothetical protein J6590_037018 [Homalodisca vitripennis]